MTDTPPSDKIVANTTPAPWSLLGVDHNGIWVIGSADTDDETTVGWIEIRKPADARLIAAAPDLLTACQAAVAANAHNDGSTDADCDRDGDCDVAIDLWVAAVQQARAAIARATGAGHE